jgi:cellulose synthase/poly-beta-1,6-N-acetylglucosamine synthase-like glycosyltransferase
VTAAEWLFWGAIALLVWVYAGYPLLAAAVGRIRPFRLAIGPMQRPLVTVGIAVHDAAQELEARVANVLEQQGPFDLELIVASDGSTDDSVALLERLAAARPQILVLDLPRGGQTVAQQQIFKRARGSIVVLSDAETRFVPGCLAQLIAPFGDPRVGCTTGRVEWLDAERTETSQSEGAYWRYEQLVRRLESRAGWLTAVTGAVLAIRRERYRDVPAHASMDHLLPLYVREEGFVVLAIPGAVATDRPIHGRWAQLRNRTRTATRGIRANLSMAVRLAVRRPSAALAIWSHKLLRWGTPLLGAVALAAAAALVASGATIYLIPLALAGVVVLLAAVGPLLAAGRPAPAWTSLPLAIIVINLAFLMGWVNLARGHRIGAWHAPDRTAPTSPAAHDRSG